MEALVLKDVASGEAALHELWIKLLKAAGETAIQQSKVMKNLAGLYVKDWRLEEIALATRLVSQNASLEHIQSYMCKGGLRSTSKVESLYSAIKEDTAGAHRLLMLFGIDTREPPETKPKGRKRRRSVASSKTPRSKAAASSNVSTDSTHVSSKAGADALNSPSDLPKPSTKKAKGGEICCSSSESEESSESCDGEKGSSSSDEEGSGSSSSSSKQHAKENSSSDMVESSSDEESSSSANMVVEESSYSSEG